MRQNQLNKDNEGNDRRYWLWVTTPEYYLDKGGCEREALEPSDDLDPGGWWTCHKDTQKGDFVLLYRARLKRDIGYLIQAESDAYSITDDPYASEKGWVYACDYRPIYKFENPVSLEDMRNNPYLHDWGAYGGNFQRSVYKIPFEHWHRLNELASQKNSDYTKFLRGVEEFPVTRNILLEEELEEALIQDLGPLKKVGYDLELVSSVDGASGRQLVCKGNGGRIDMLCYDRKKKRYVVIELKNVRASQNTFGQICNYVSWVQDRVADGKPVIGLVISRGYDVRFQSSMKMTEDKIFHLNIEQLGFE